MNLEIGIRAMFFNFVDKIAKKLYVTPQPGGPLTTRQPAEYSWMSGNLPDIHENRAESPLYGELYPDTSPVI